MSKKEQDALLALLNSFKVSKRITTFDQLSDGKVLMEVCVEHYCCFDILADCANSSCRQCENVQSRTKRPD
jgi:hypothetical protein